MSHLFLFTCGNKSFKLEGETEPGERYISHVEGEAYEAIKGRSEVVRKTAEGK